MADHGWNAVSMDARGHGESDWDSNGDYSFDALVSDLSYVVSTLDTSPVLIGASMGGTTAILAQGERKLARALALIDIVPNVESDGVRRIKEFMSAAPNGFASLQEAANAIQRYNPRRKRPPTVEGLKRSLWQSEDGRWRWHWDPRILELDPKRNADRISEAARAIDVPTIVFRGRESDVVSAAGVDAFFKLVPHAQCVEVEGVGHMVGGDDNEAFTSQLLAFLRLL